MHIELKDYQEKGVVRLREAFNELLDTQNNEVLIFKSPTGSGKTIMVAEAIRRIIDSRIDGKQLSFLWIAVNKLHDQSRDNLKKYYEGEAVGVKCSNFSELKDRQIQENEILFLNWASINKKENLYIKDNERDNNLSSIISRTKEAGKTIVLIIDESHHTASSDKSKEIIDIIGPKVTIEVSATPQMTSDNIVPVRIDDVRSEGMIKKEVSVNNGFTDIVDIKRNDQTADELVLRSALEKRKELLEALKKENSSVNPLVLIQLPDAKRGVPDKKDEVLQMLVKFGYKNEDERIAIYLTGKEKINLENIEKPQNEVEVMLFKQAIALGWDCPRAVILVLFRQWTESNITFSIQTLGRIMRMPEHKYYADEKLNQAYLYTSLPDIETRIEQSDMKGEIKPYRGIRIDSYKDINIDSYHTKRFREETRLSSDFVQMFIDTANELDLKTKVDFKYRVQATKLIADGKIDNVDSIGRTIQNAGSVDVTKNEVELQRAFDMFVRDNLEPYYPEQRSIKRINESIYAYFGARRDEDRWAEIQAVVIADENKEAVINVITRAKEIYQESIAKGKNEVVKNDNQWNVPESISYDINHTKKEYKKSVIKPYYARKVIKGKKDKVVEEDSAIEGVFIEFLEKAKNVTWWFKNNTSDSTYFAVPYKEHGVEKSFYVDFVVLMKDGSIGIFDTKAGITAETAGPRAEGLSKYISAQKKQKMFGGIVVRDGKSWKYNSESKYNYNPNDLTGWKFLEI